MRSVFSMKPQFLFCDAKDHPVTRVFYDKYNQISSMLDNNYGIIKKIHDELTTSMNASKGRKSKFSTESIFRMLLVKCIEQLSFRDLFIRVNNSTFLRNFTRIGFGELMGIGLLDAAWKNISADTWGRINKLFLKYALKEKKISGTDLRLDSTVCECNIHYPTDSSLLWNSYRVLSRELHKIMAISPELSKGFRFNKIKIKQLHTFISTRSGSNKKRTQQKVRKAMRILIERVDASWEKGISISDILLDLQLTEIYQELKALLLNVNLVINQGVNISTKKRFRQKTGFSAYLKNIRNF